MTVVHHWTVSDLENLPSDRNRYEIVGGELYISNPNYYHQRVCFKIGVQLEAWSDRTGLGEVNSAPGVIFSDEDAVAPDLIWISNARLASALDDDGKLYQAPELVIEVLSPGSDNELRDRDIKLELYSRYGVQEYWLIDWRARSIKVYSNDGTRLVLAATLHGGEVLQSSILPGFSCALETLFGGIPS